VLRQACRARSHQQPLDVYPDLRGLSAQERLERLEELYR
jgi:hypothetical protein